jgi:hypothetical protein
MKAYMVITDPPRDGAGYVLPPGFLAHTMLPLIRLAGFTADGDVDDNGNIKIRVRTI